MTREEKIEQAALAYSFDTDGGHSGDLNAGRDDFIEGAKWADEHPANFWHRVADGDLPTLAKGDDISLPFLIEAKDGSSCRAYYGYDEFDALEFFDDCGCALNVEYWAEIPKLPLKELSMGGLFDIPKDKKPTKFCRTCAHRQRWECGNKVIQYCGKRKSNRTFNGLMKIKVTQPACELYEEELKSKK